MAARLKKAMDDNIRLHAHNRCLKETNQKYLEIFAQKDTEYQKHAQLNSNARHEVNFKELHYNAIKDNILGIEYREKF